MRLPLLVGGLAALGDEIACWAAFVVWVISRLIFMLLGPFFAST
ncbi:MAG TPA: hypothetical protein VEL12_05535 [Candidatus Nitrosopolaris sp.]|nr:hypothetical protein [Candidatus Nitrosopolaris sp.]